MENEMRKARCLIRTSELPSSLCFFVKVSEVEKDDLMRLITFFHHIPIQPGMIHLNHSLSYTLLKLTLHNGTKTYRIRRDAALSGA